MGKSHKIYLRFNISIGSKRCALSEKNFESWLPLGFFLDGDFKKPIAPSIALDKGFTMLDDEFLKLANQIDIYCNFARKKVLSIPEKARVLQQKVMKSNHSGKIN